MNTRLLLCTTILATPLFLANGPADATAGPGGHPDCHEQLVPAVLPHTPDAIEAWFRACYQRQGGLEPISQSDCHAQLDPAQLPHTPDAIEAWFRACYERQGGLEPTGPPDHSRGSVHGDPTNHGVLPSWMPRDPPTNWRRLMNQIEPDPDGVGPPLDWRRLMNQIEPDPNVNGPPPDWRRLMDQVDTPPPTGPAHDTAPNPSTADGPFDYGQIALGGLAGATIVAAVAGTLVGRRRRQPQLETALASTDPEELPRAAGLLGDRFAEQDRPDAAEHAYRAAINVGDNNWSPIAQVALADLLNDRGDRAEAQALLEAAIATGHPRAVPAAQTSLHQLATSNSHRQAAGPLRRAYETLEDATSANRKPAAHR